MLALAALGAADERPPAVAWSVEDVVRLEEASGFDISPDGQRVVWQKSRLDEKGVKRVTDHYLTLLEDGTEIQLTRAGKGDDSPRWSPDGRWIALASLRPPAEGAEGGEEEAEGEEGDDEEAARQIWILDPRGGEPWRLTKLEKGIEGFAWLSSGALLFSAREDLYHRERTLKESKDDSVVVEDREEFLAIRLFAVDLEAKKVRRVTDNDDRIDEFAPSPDGRWAVARHVVSPHYEADAREKPKYFLYELKADGIASRREIFPDRLFFPYGFVWARDSSGFYGLRTQTSDYENNGPGVETVYWFDVTAMEHRQVDLSWPNGVSSGTELDATADGFLALLADGPINRLARFTRRPDGSHQRALVEDERGSHVASFEAGPDGETVVFTHSTASTPPASVAGRLSGARIGGQKQIARVNQHLKDRRMARSEVVRWKGALGDEISGILYHPLDYREGSRHPLVLMIHGGPAGADMDLFDESWAYYAHLMAGRGAFILKPNYHGSSNHGQQFVESIRGHYYEYEIPDILAGVDALVGQGKVDPQRLGVIGWSNGAILTWELITSTDRFKAAAPGAGDVNWSGDYGNCSFGPQFSNYYMGGPPWEKTEVYVQKSPHFRLERVRTPTIIFFGTEDRAVDPGQGWEAFRALQMIGQAPVRFILFPGEPHGLRTPAHQRRKMEEEIAWFDQHLFGTAKPPARAIKEGSPLDRELKLKAAAREGVLFGVSRRGTLVPETVWWEERGIGVGRFEVTRAQFGAFDRLRGGAVGEGNLPASGVALDRAREYVDWLSRRTGERYRLPTVEEMEQLLEKAGDDLESEVTLDSWAGFPLNPDDAESLGSAAAALGEAGLLRPVGSALPAVLGPGPGGEKAGSVLYDLDGNVSEWATQGGSGRAMGGNAARARDRRQGGEVASSPAYTGLRVVREGRP